MKEAIIKNIKYLIISICLISLYLIYRYTKRDCKESTIIPKYIWQTYKTKQLPERALTLRDIWIHKNPGWKTELYDDDDIDKYINVNWSISMYNFFKALPIGVMKADLWRYLILTTHGGVYSDIDSNCLTPVNCWFNNFKGDQALVFGLENDDNFCQWTIYATKEHPAMRSICQYMLDRYEKDGIDTTNPHFVHNTTGPSIWTDAIINYLNVDVNTKHRAKDVFEMYKKNPTYFNDLGIYILSINYFQNIYTQNEYGSQNFGDDYIKWIDQVNKLTQNK